MLRWIQYSVGTLLALVAVGFLLLGARFTSYVRTSANSVQESVQDSVPLEFELRRARDMIEAILPDLQSQVRVIAQEEVAIASLESDLVASSNRLQGEQATLASLRDEMRVQQVSYSVGDRKLSRQQLAEQLHQRLARYKQGELAVQSKTRLLAKRRDGLDAALAVLDKMQNRKVELEQKVEALAAQSRLLKASEVEAGIAVDGSRLSDADELLAQIETRLAVAQRVLAHEQDAFAIPLEQDVVIEENVLSAYDQHFGRGAEDDAEDNDGTLVRK
ncbi:hypothetical protein SAMN06265222_11599 [Neorhodopirellula lusitana]|uniref:Signal peptide-containing protein n=1 Tax=Neorhodopirellula lusitana TaxID=445327 RepID=A0ABY1QMH1_9BACT|nr:signal peptide-containing protein [Neorhodopirellula lusitana]SMP72550.1 hypothetical protein SAMN06265222_11599 [Neorhodopirellula lusitana]